MEEKVQISEDTPTKITMNINKLENFIEWYEEVLKVAEIIDNRYPVKGMIVWKPYGYKALKLMLRIMEDILDKYNHEEANFPMLIPESIFKKESDFLEGFRGESYVVTQAGNTELTEKMYLRPTSETVMYEMFKLWIRSKSDLPLKLYQTVNIFRYETKMTKAILRVREIIKFKEAHTCHLTMEDADKQIVEGIQIYKEFFDSMLLPYIILRTPKWDTFAGAEYNYDFISVMPDGKGVELGSVINLGNRFAKAFDIKYQKDDDSYEYVYQTCYGVSERALAVAFSIHGDDKGAIFPSSIAPIQIIIIPIIFKGKENIIIEKCNEIKKILEENGFRVKIDDRDKNPGDKYYYWEAKGVPLRIEIGPRDIKKKQVMIVRRDTFQKISKDEGSLIKSITEIFKQINENLKERANKYLFERVFYFKNIEEFRDNKTKNGIVTLPWCGNKDCGIELENLIDMPSLGYIPNEYIKENCLICGKKEDVRWLYFGRTY